MFKEVSLEVKSRNDLLEAAKNSGAELAITDCQPLDRARMIMILDLAGPSSAVDETIAALRKLAGVEHAVSFGSDAPGTRVLLTLAKPGVCRASAGDALMCLDCPFNSTEVPARWRFVAKLRTDVGQIVSRLAAEGVQAKVEDVSPLDEDSGFTDKEKGMMVVAIQEGYFDFPRRITLEALSQLLGVETAELRKTFARVE